MLNKKQPKETKRKVQFKTEKKEMFETMSIFKAAMYHSNRTFA